jgi:menaquinone-dependent protoporphyrinogen IX oxidase
MSNTIVLYQSKYGATRKYAEWLSGELGCELIETRNANINEVEKHSTVILGGGIYATGIAGLSFIKKYYSRLKDKKIIVFAVGASPYDNSALIALKERNFKNEIANIPCFYCRGAWNENDMTFKDKTLCNMLKKAVSKKDPSTYEPWEKALVEAVGSHSDWTDKENLAPILEYVRTV